MRRSLPLVLLLSGCTNIPRYPYSCTHPPDPSVGGRICEESDDPICSPLHRGPWPCRENDYVVACVQRTRVLYFQDPNITCYSGDRVVLR